MTDYMFIEATIETTYEDKPATVRVGADFEDPIDEEDIPLRNITFFIDKPLDPDFVEDIEKMIEDIIPSQDDISVDFCKDCTHINIFLPADFDETMLNDSAREFVFCLNPFFSGKLTIKNF